VFNSFQLRSVRPVLADLTVNDGDDLCGCKIVATPGHTPGHISLYLPDQGVVIAGDAMALENGVPAIANPQFTLDPKAAKASMDKLLSLGADIYVCYHGGTYQK
jgi:glyoxylase-like metal-dependent hydrolase (beta-lactamase superfamily II)